MNNNIIIGNGLIANSFKRHLKGDENLVVFASGVSNSSENDDQEYEREKKLLEHTISKYETKHLIYFSTISIFDPSLGNRKYINFKKQIEIYLSKFNNCTVIRASNIIGKGGNPKTMINYFIQSLKENSKVMLWKNAERNILGVDDLALVTIQLLKKDRTQKCINMIYPISFNPCYIFSEIQNYFNLQGKFEMIEAGKKYVPKIEDNLLEVYEELGIEITQDYIKLLLKKYF